MQKNPLGYALIVLLVSGTATAAHARDAASHTHAHGDANIVQNCSAAGGGKPASCARVACDAKDKAFLGTWSGKFEAYVRKQSTPGHTVFRPYSESVTYAVGDCLRNTANGDIFIVGHQTDRYPAFGKLPTKVSRSLLITGHHAGGTPFLRTVGDDGTYDYALVYQNQAASLSIWQLHLPASKGNPEMAFTTIDGRDFNTQSKYKRDVTITMQVGPSKAPYWSGVIAYGWHARQG